MEMNKIAIAGKGGSGKSTVAALLAHSLRDRGYRVLVVDSDESNPGLYRTLGFDERPEPLLELVGGKKKVFDTFSDSAGPSTSVLTHEEVRTSDLPPGYIVEKDNIKLVSVGKILQSLEGCACPMGALSREFLGRLRLQEDEIAVIDMEAGVEHFGRGVETSVDTVLAVTEPSFDSLEIAEKISTLAKEVGIDSVWAILNKISSQQVASKLSAQLKQRDVPIIGTIRYDPDLLEAGLEGRPVTDGQAARDIKQILDRLL
jgi:CO dehydrogenase maturation factor